MKPINYTEGEEEEEEADDEEDGWPVAELNHLVLDMEEVCMRHSQDPHFLPISSFRALSQLLQ